MIGLAEMMVREKLTLEELQPEDIGKGRTQGLPVFLRHRDRGGGTEGSPL